MYRCHRVPHYGSPPLATQEDAFTKSTADIQRTETPTAAVRAIPTSSEEIQRREANSISAPTTEADDYNARKNVSNGDFCEQREGGGKSDMKEQGGEGVVEGLGSRFAGMTGEMPTAAAADAAGKPVACREHALEGMVYLGPR